MVGALLPVRHLLGVEGVVAGADELRLVDNTVVCSGGVGGGGCCGCCCGLCSGRWKDDVQRVGDGDAGGGERHADREEEHRLHAAASVEAVAAGYSD